MDIGRLSSRFSSAGFPTSLFELLGSFGLVDSFGAGSSDALVGFSSSLGFGASSFVVFEGLASSPLLSARSSFSSELRGSSTDVADILFCDSSVVTFFPRWYSFLFGAAVGGAGGGAPAEDMSLRSITCACVRFFPAALSMDFVDFAFPIAVVVGDGCLTIAVVVAESFGVGTFPIAVEAFFLISPSAFLASVDFAIL